MASKEDDLDLDIESAKKSGGGLAKILLIVVLGLVLVGGSVAATVLLMGNDTHHEDEEDSEASDDEEEGVKHKKKKKKKKKHKKKKAKKDKKVKKKPVYVELGKPIVVNLGGNSRTKFLQVAVALMTYSEKDAEEIKKHLPVIRHHLVLLYSSQKFSEIQTIAGKKKLQADSLKVIREELEKLIDKPLVEEVYLPSIVGQ